MTLTPQATAEQAANELRERTGVDGYDVALVMGSGWAPAADLLGDSGEEFASAELTGFLPPAVDGHSGTIRSITDGDRHILAFLGRTHLYEGHGTDAVVHGVRTAVAAGAGTIVLTNAAGGIAPGYSVGSPVLIADHINMTALSPLSGASFVDLSETYSAELRAIARKVDPDLAEGVYAAMPGPHFETPAEIRMLRALGADLVGMSTVLEAIAARAAGARVLGMSLVTNIAAGLEGANLDHEEVLATGRDSAETVGRLLADIVGRI
ncbi:MULTISPECIES: purine-nucleoside phosphorylase [Nocardiopsis]|uniref:Purine nucleoside phosphorylase n=2 Tax=Nocardiopsis alba TaxID=53437 RepID=A0A7K2INH9_9ACTN|nr:MULTISPECIES: purine-nucleoside phosphorylase [Nocardiopsis]AFR09245.1 purine nucleoside phosphorylase [Nocardiopsis alba ATCC BAA-2165]MEC3895510.1 purine-nucleoside phosphorylase [Nocardiopsis sp. LDBS1602]MYR31324.1 purine-nucleoside phosphorylase [Nocardiopsis alba]